jgi:integrase
LVFTAPNIHTLMAEDMLEIIAAIEPYRSPYIDGKILAVALKLAYYTGIKKQEILSLKIRDVADAKGEIVTEIQSCAKIVDGRTLRLILTEEVRAILRDYLVYLKKNGNPVNRSALLFPQKTRTGTSAYHETKINRDFQKAGCDLTLEKARIKGIRRIFSSMRGDHRNIKQMRFEHTAEFARTSIRNIKMILGEYSRVRSTYSVWDTDDNYFPVGVGSESEWDDDDDY